MTEQEQVAPRRGFDGSRWLNQRPTPEEVVAWFEESFAIDPALKHSDYVGGIALIPAVEGKAKFVCGFTQDGKPIIDERPEMSYVPYARVETRINYWWSLLAAHEDWVGVVEHVESPRLDVEPAVIKETTDEHGNGTTEYARPGGLATMVHQLPTGFSIATIPVGDSYSHFLCCTIRVSIYKADEGGDPKGIPLRTGRGTKQIPLVRRGWNNSVVADENSLMRCETGALGRALGFAGVFVLSGSGVATAEDMQDALAQGDTPAQAAEPTVPDVKPPSTGTEKSADDETALKARALELFTRLREDFPGRVEDFTVWAHERKLKSLGEARGAVLIGTVRKLEKLVDEGEREAQQGPEEPERVPAPTPTESG
jgi:hypothetical protein